MPFKIVGVQTAIFLNSIDLSSKLKIAASINEIAGDCLGVDPILLPLPPNSPAELPHIIMKNDKTGWQFTLSPARMNLVSDATKSPGCNSYRDAIEMIQHVTLEVWNKFNTTFGARANRVGFVFSSILDIENASNFLCHKYLRTNEAENAEQILLHFLHKIEIPPFSLNKWTRITSVQKSLNDISNIRLDIDLNIQPERPIELSIELLNNFFEIANATNTETIYQHEQE